VQYAAPPQVTVMETFQQAPQPVAAPVQVSAPTVTTVANPYLEQQRMASVPMAAPQMMTVQPQMSSYIPAAEPRQMPQVSSYIPAPAPQVTYAPQATVVGMAPQYQQPVSYIPAPIVMEQAQVVQYAQSASTTMAAPASYLPAPMVEYAQPQVVQSAQEQAQVRTLAAPVSYLPAPMVEYAQPQVVEQLGGQSVIVEQIGDWQVCEDAQGIFFHHVLTQQSHDTAPPEFLCLFPQGYNAPPLGAFAQAPQMIETFAQPQVMMQSQPQVTYAASPQVMQQGMMMQQSMGAPVVETIVQGGQMMATNGQSQMMMQGQPQMQGQLPPIMAKVLN